MNDTDENHAEAPLMSHFLELRTRLMRAVICVALVAIPCVYFANTLFEFLSAPLIAKLPEDGQVIATSVTSGFMAPFKLALFVALFISIPYALHQAWAFVAPGLYRNEKRFAVPLLISSALLFYVGIFFAYTLVFPIMFAFFAQSAPQGVAMMTDISSYLDFVMVMFLAFGVAFEFPVVVMLLVLTGLASVTALKKNRAYVLLGVFVVAAFLTPADAISMCMMAVPMYLLYEAGLLLAQLLARSAAERPAS
ncbi:MAG: twin-arginine translocase subunit TatC [Pseudomonadota bacterium]|nr:twin-arginine translocase subunit TatC [Pseudomonadota bacterium]